MTRAETTNAVVYPKRAVAAYLKSAHTTLREFCETALERRNDDGLTDWIIAEEEAWHIEEQAAQLDLVWCLIDAAGERIDFDTLEMTCFVWEVQRQINAFADAVESRPRINQHRLHAPSASH